MTSRTDEVSAVQGELRGRLLLVDDEENILRSLKRVLRRTGWEIETAPDGARGLLLLGSFRPQVVISDFRMPGMNGVEFLSEVKAASPRTQRIMLTGQADQHAIEEAINRSEIFRFISKPWNDAQLVLTVKSAFEQFELASENERLLALTQSQNDSLRALNQSLEERVSLRTQQLSIAKRAWELTFDAIDIPVAIISNDFRVHRANRAFARVGGHAITEVGAAPRCHKFLFGTDTPCPGCPLSNGCADSEIAHAGRSYHVRAYPMPEEGHNVCIYRDVTEEKQVTQRMIETEKMAAVGQLAGGVAHEINNPLGGILAFSQLMKRDAGRSRSDLDALGLIEESAIRCKRIVESLLKFSRKSTLADRAVLDVNRTVEETLALFEAQLKSAPDVKLTFSGGDELPAISASAIQLGQVLLNLLQNGLQALPDRRGTLWVKTFVSDGRVHISVKDSGTGIDPSNLPHIFEPSFTTKPPGEGTGLGLSIVYRIVQDHGGEITVDTVVGVGSTFTVKLPVVPTGVEKGQS